MKDKHRNWVALLWWIGSAALAFPQPAAVPRAEHPRPDMVRADWATLNGEWQFAFDDANRGLEERWYREEKPFTRRIVVPFCFQSKRSGIGDTAYHDVVWYRRNLDIPEAWKGRQVYVQFGAVDYEATVWVNGEQAGFHRGGTAGFAVDITPFLRPKGNAIVVRAYDPSADRGIPRGKQYWEPASRGIWYTRTSGIWQSVWMEARSRQHIRSLRVIPDVDRSQVTIEAVVSQADPGLRFRATALADKEVASQSETACRSLRPTVTLRLEGQRLWRPERPLLYDLTLELVAGSQTVDRVESYFGQRKVGVLNGKVTINDDPCYLKLVLDQGYWPESILTPPSDEAIRYDIEMARKFGFNGARKHQKVEDPRWHYWCDKLGFLVWGEMANAQEFNPRSMALFQAEWQEVVERDWNHPSVIAWVPINESWGIPQVYQDAAQQSFAKNLYYLTKALDPTRLVVDNDGWEHTDATDLFTIHDYSPQGAMLAERYQPLEKGIYDFPYRRRGPLALGYKYNGTPVLLTEFGGIAYRLDASEKKDQWGYSGIEPSKESMLARLKGQIDAIRGNRVIAGYCYTQLTDVEQEINGMMTYDRKPKADPAEFAAILNR